MNTQCCIESECKRGRNYLFGAANWEQQAGENDDPSITKSEY